MCTHRPRLSICGKFKCYIVDGKEQALQLFELGGGEAEKARDFVLHSTCRMLIALKCIYMNNSQ